MTLADQNSGIQVETGPLPGDTPGAAEKRETGLSAGEPPLEEPLVEEPPPVLKTWRNLYLLVLGNLLLWILLFYIFTWTFE